MISRSFTILSSLRSFTRTRHPRRPSSKSAAPMRAQFQKYKLDRYRPASLSVNPLRRYVPSLFSLLLLAGWRDQALLRASNEGLFLFSPAAPRGAETLRLQPGRALREQENGRGVLLTLASACA